MFILIFDCAYNYLIIYIVCIIFIVLIIFIVIFIDIVNKNIKIVLQANMQERLIFTIIHVG